MHSSVQEFAINVEGVHQQFALTREHPLGQLKAGPVHVEGLKCGKFGGNGTGIKGTGKKEHYQLGNRTPPMIKTESTPNYSTLHPIFLFGKYRIIHLCQIFFYRGLTVYHTPLTYQFTFYRTPCPRLRIFFLSFSVPSSPSLSLVIILFFGFCVCFPPIFLQMYCIRSFCTVCVGTNPGETLLCPPQKNTKNIRRSEIINTLRYEHST